MQKIPQRAKQINCFAVGTRIVWQEDAAVLSESLPERHSSMNHLIEVKKTAFPVSLNPNSFCIPVSKSVFFRLHLWSRKKEPGQMTTLLT
jgi:hypothetical protein